jgi:hypothetical protein
MLCLAKVISAGPDLIPAGDTAAGTAIPAKSSVSAKGMASDPSRGVPNDSVALAVKTPRSKCLTTALIRGTTAAAIMANRST